MTPDLVTIASGALRAAINPLGAELWSLTDSDAREFLTDADPAFWTGHAPLLFPAVGSSVDDRIVVDGVAYPLPRHGFARRSRFAVIDRGPAHATFRLTDSAATRAAYPFAFVLDMTFRIEGTRLAMIARVANPGAAMLPFSFGFHPAFAWPLPGGADKAAHRISFACDEPQPVRRVDRATGVLLPHAEPSPVSGRELALDPALFAADALIWTALASRSLRYHAPGGSALAIAFPDCPMLGLWQVPGARYLCIEPWAGHADPQGFAGEFASRPGVMLLAPGAAREFRMIVDVEAA